MRELVATLAGVIVGWIFNEITMFFRERPKLTKVNPFVKTFFLKN